MFNLSSRGHKTYKFVASGYPVMHSHGSKRKIMVRNHILDILVNLQLEKCNL